MCILLEGMGGTEQYRKMRNTLRYLAGNVFDVPLEDAATARAVRGLGRGDVRVAAVAGKVAVGQARRAQARGARCLRRVRLHARDGGAHAVRRLGPLGLLPGRGRGPTLRLARHCAAPRAVLGRASGLPQDAAAPARADPPAPGGGALAGGPLQAGHALLQGARVD